MANDESRCQNSHPRRERNRSDPQAPGLTNLGTPPGPGQTPGLGPEGRTERPPSLRLPRFLAALRALNRARARGAPSSALADHLATLDRAARQRLRVEQLTLWEPTGGGLGTRGGSGPGGPRSSSEPTGERPGGRRT